MSNFHFGENLRKIRESKDISQEAMAASLHISQPTYSRIENQSTMSNYDLVCRIAKVLDNGPEKFLPPSDKHPLTGPILAITAEPFLNTALGMVILVGASGALIAALYDYTWHLCQYLNASDETILFVRWTVPIATTGFIVYLVRKIRKKK